MADSIHTSTDIVNMFLMITCHQPYSELEKIPFEEAIRWMEIFNSKSPSPSTKRGFKPEIPPEFEEQRKQRLRDRGIIK